MNYFDEVVVKPEIETLYLKVMESIFWANESNQCVLILKKHKDNLISARKRSWLHWLEKFVMNEIERDSYSFMKPRLKEEISKLKELLSDLETKETNYNKYLKSGINLLQNWETSTNPQTLLTNKSSLVQFSRKSDHRKWQVSNRP
ncbi:MAG: hypothetical protein U5K54_04720 [Cytophagales bacterium]|nr:hypothetical protein [Cytophagales bacterium]